MRPVRFALATLVCAVLLSLVPPVPATRAATGVGEGQGQAQVVAVVGGQPDDITIDARGRLVWGDLQRGAVYRLDGGKITTALAGISLPEGIVALPDGGLIVAEQGRDRILRTDGHGRTMVIRQLVPVPGQEGVDGLGRDPRSGDLFVPDAPRGVVLRLSVDGRRPRVIARGLGRPVAAALDGRGDVLAPDETLGTLVVIAPDGALSRLGALPTPDDVSVDRHGRAWVTTLGDGGLWVVDPGSAPRRVLVGLANPQGLTLDSCGDPVFVEQNRARIDRLLLTSASARCAF